MSLDRSKIKELKACPILDCLFEFRYGGALENAHEVMPGMLYSSLPGGKIVHSVPHIPIDIIKNDPNLHSLPTFIIQLDKAFVSGNHQFVAVTYKMPYKGWTDFKAVMHGIHKILFNGDLFKTITRYSIKYADLIKKNGNSALDLVKMDLNVCGKKIKDEFMNLHIQFKEGHYQNIAHLVTQASVTMRIKTHDVLNGLLLTTDTFRLLDDEPIAAEKMMSDYDERLDEIHDVNKRFFFELLSDEAIELLRPVTEDGQ